MDVGIAVRYPTATYLRWREASRSDWQKARDLNEALTMRQVDYEVYRLLSLYGENINRYLGDGYYCVGVGRRKGCSYYMLFFGEHPVMENFTEYYDCGTPLNHSTLLSAGYSAHRLLWKLNDGITGGGSSNFGWVKNTELKQ